MKYYVIECENGAFTHGEFNGYSQAQKYAESFCNGHDFTISEYDSFEDFENNM